jgi:hypothetical protein
MPPDLHSERSAWLRQLICVDVSTFIYIIATMDERAAFETKRDLLLITGIPGTGKTTYGDKFAKEFGFLHRDLEDPQTTIHLLHGPLRRLNRNDDAS